MARRREPTLHQGSALLFWMLTVNEHGLKLGIMGAIVGRAKQPRAAQSCFRVPGMALLT